MNPKISRVLKYFVAAPLFLPAGLTGRAFLIAVLFVVCHLLGWREHTTFLSGTSAAAGTGISSSAVFGIIYMAGYFGLVLLTPILLLAALMLLAWDWLTGSRKLP